MKAKVVVKKRKTTRPPDATSISSNKPNVSDSTSEPTATEKTDAPTARPDAPSAVPDSTKKPESGSSGGDVSKDEKIPEELQEIPSDYFTGADRKGILVELNYETYESKTYEQKSKKLDKRAIVYLPYGYTENEKYNVFYLMHGGWSNETSWLGTPENPGAFKNVIDHAIDDGKMKPFIIVCPTYNNESPPDSSDYTLAYYTLTVNYHNELMNDLIPAVEGRYSTYAEDVTPEGIKASRDHRAFGGFSMGSVTTWHTFLNCLDAFRYFMPSSGAIDSTGNRLDQAVAESGYTWRDFFIFAATGTSDFACSQFTNQINGMLSQDSGNFKEADNEAEGNLAFRIKEGYSHDGRASMEYAYNGMLWFWNHGGDSSPIQKVTEKTLVKDVMSNPVFGSYGRLLFPVHRNISAYYLWGGSAGARMAAVLGNRDYLRELTGRSDVPQAAAVIMQYTGYTDTSKTDAPTYACVGTHDGIASWNTMKSRLDGLKKLGIPTEFHKYEGLSHGFGIGTGTVAEGWIDDAVKFWENR